MLAQKTSAISEVCQALWTGSADTAKLILAEKYPYAPETITQRRYGPVESTRVFVRDGFIDRYSGDPLIFPPVLRVLSEVMPVEFPYHPNWKTDRTHPAYWEVGATIDHLIPVTRGGKDEPANWVTTSMARNSAKMNWMLAELGWELHPPGDVRDWDGMLGWFLGFVEENPELLKGGSVHQWYRAAKLAAERPATESQR
ncbi:MAG TPA: hypothetical protein VK002_07845 [Rubricoccaceae bacterium]|nr:hypothetical protein [Rubricoccaceae bacterium]